MKNKSRLVVEIEEELRQKLKIIAAKENKSMKKLIEEYINNLLYR